MRPVDIFTDSVNVLKLRKTAFENVMRAPFSHSFFVLALVSFFGALGYWIFPSSPFEALTYRPDFFWILARSLSNFLFYAFSFAFIGFLANFQFKSKLTTGDFFKVMSHASISGLLLLLPVLWPAFILSLLFVAYEVLTRWGGIGGRAVLMLIFIQFVFTILSAYQFEPF